MQRFCRPRPCPCDADCELKVECSLCPLHSSSGRAVSDGFIRLILIINTLSIIILIQLAIMVSNYNRGDNARGDAYGVGGIIGAVVLGGIAFAIGGPVAGAAVFTATAGGTSAMAAEPQTPNRRK